MAVYADEKQRTFTLQTKNTTYQMKVDAYGMLLHTYYGEKTDNSDLSYRIPPDDRGFSGYAYEASCATDFPQILRRRSTAVSERGITGSVPCASEMKTGARR